MKLVMKIILFAEENLKIIFKDVFFLEWEDVLLQKHFKK
jgi:hypothetical protein